MSRPARSRQVEPAAPEPAGAGLATLLAQVDGEGRNVFTSPAVRDWLGVTPEEVSGLPVQELLGAEQWAMVGSRVALALAGVPQRFERPLRLGGREVWTLTQYLPRVVRGRPDGFYVLVDDIGRRVRAEEQLRVAARLADDVLQHLFATGLAVRRLERHLEPAVLADLTRRLQHTSDQLRRTVSALSVPGSTGLGGTGLGDPGLGDPGLGDPTDGPRPFPRVT